MTETELMRAVGEPRSVNNTLTGNGLRKQHVYGNGSYVYTENGRVTTVQWTDAPEKPVRSCPTEIEIRNWNMTVADRKYKTYEERALAAERVRLAQRCRAGQ
jgi:hypothetical protein